ncbi:uncharacterized protein [Blastocystis hominis]|uniref:Vesicle transport protein n=1 Tax=Blastocystis hominis TaxID=12968 RepID=D8LX93_BLAHO|nr:uncharacterized protein [Blastocystis hominis]CBK20888.2 unnamed protein product [Blastocystis hominis]|eukprot:XP_012894936.1 uncharacterized protein [Blastocystis hominis]
MSNSEQLNQNLMEEEVQYVLSNNNQYRTIPTRHSAVSVQEIGGSYFIQYEDNMVSLADLARYRKVYIANNRYMYVVNIVLGAILLFTSFFSKAWFTICMCLIYFLSSLLFYYSFTMISKRYTLVVRFWFVPFMKAMTAFISGIASFVLSLFSLNKSSYGARGFLAVEFVIIFFVFVLPTSFPHS